MIEFFVVCCLYKWVNCFIIKGESHFYVFCGVVNLIMLYLTGCRTAFIPLALVVPVFFICYGERKWILLSIGLFLAGIIAVLLIPDLIPRLSDISTLESRFDIWHGAFQGIAMYPLLEWSSDIWTLVILYMIGIKLHMLIIFISMQFHLMES